MCITLCLKPAPPQEPHKAFKSYEPGFVHMDVKYLSQMQDEAKQRYLFVAIDRATRWVFVIINAIAIGNAVNKGFTLRINQVSVKRHLTPLIEHIQAGRIKPSEVITHRMPFEEVTDAYHVFSSKLDKCIKTVLVPLRALSTT